MTAETSYLGWLRTRWVRFDGRRGRQVGIDLARGLAVIGMFAAHMVATPAFDWSDTATWTGIVNGRSAILFATLAGVSITLSTGGARGIARDDVGTARGRFAIRALCIWILGLVLMALPVPIFVILSAYAILFLLALPTIRLSVPVLFGIAAATALVGPFLVHAIDDLGFWDAPGGAIVESAIGWHYPFVMWAAFVLAGMAIGRMRLGDQVVMTTLLGAGLLLAWLGDGAIAPLTEPGSWREALTGAPHASGVGEAVGSGGFAIAVIALCVLLCRTPFRWLVIPIRAVGSMPLTAYASQFIVWVMLTPASIEPLGAFRELEPFWPFTLATLAGCTAWALLIGRGPLEWAISALARTLIPTRQRPEEPTA